MRFISLGIFIAVLLSACGPARQLPQDTSDAIELDTIRIHADPQPQVYKGSKKRVNDLVHTKLDIRFNWDSAFVEGTATLDVTPFRSSVRELVLDAKGFIIHEVKAGKKDSLRKAPYTYDNNLLTIDLGKSYAKTEMYQVLIRYTAMPNKRKEKTGTAITSDKGLYFIIPDSADKSGWQIWTQGETESNSAWFPTIDAPNEKMTHEIIMTVDTMFETLSNGLLLFETDNRDGTKTAYWKMDLPHAPYLAMIAVGDYAIIKDSWRNIEVNYMVEKEYEKFAKNMFSNCPEMMEFYSDLLGVDYPWPKLSHVVVKEYVSGAMENTSAIIYGEFIQQTDRERLDKDYEDFVAHELFHHWFGDLVTCESWANLPLNESFATYGEYLWIAHKYGQEEGDHHLNNDLKSYLSRVAGNPKKMIRYDYDTPDDMFDHNSYQKGGRILHLLRAYLGDEVFFEALTFYLKKFQYNSAEIHQLRHAFEEKSGEDLNWFFEQWFFSPGHPELEISWEYQPTQQRVKLTIHQQQDFKRVPLFRLPMKVDIYSNGKKETHSLVVDKAFEEFYFDGTTKPDLVNVDAQKIFLGKKKDIKSDDEWRYMYQHAPLYMDRLEAIEHLVNSKDSLTAIILTVALDDPHWKIRQKAIFGVANAKYGNREMIKEKLMQLAQNDPKSLVRSVAIDALVGYSDDENLLGLYEGAIGDDSYEVVSSALNALTTKDEAKGMLAARKLEKESNRAIIRTIADMYGKFGTARENEFFIKASDQLTRFDRFSFLLAYADYLERQNDSIVSLGIHTIGKTIQNESTWWIRIAGVNAITDLQLKYKVRKSSTEDKIASFKEDNPNKEIYQKMLKSTDELLQQINTLIAALKEKEEHEKVLKVLE